MNAKLKFLLLVLFFCISALVCAGCGRKGRPRPPEEIAPGAVLYFTAIGTLEGVRLGWQAPVSDARGEPLLNLSGFVVEKRALIDKDSSDDFEDIAEIGVQYAPSSKSDDSKSESKGNDSQKRYEFLDRDVAPGKRYEYVVYAVDNDGAKGRRSPVMRVTYIGESSIVTTVSN